MKLSVEYRAEYRYEAKVSLSPHLVRLFPREALQARVGSFRFATNKNGSVHWRHDLFDNTVAQCFYPHDDDRLVFSLDAQIEQRFALRLCARERNQIGSNPLCLRFLF